MLRPIIGLFLALLLTQPASALLAEPADDRLLKVNVPAVISISGLMGGGPHQVTTPPLATCSTSVTHPTTTSTDVDVTCTFPDPIYCGDAVVVSGVAATTNGRLSVDGWCGGRAAAFCSTSGQLDPGFPWDYNQCRAHDPGIFNLIDGSFDPIGAYAQTITCSATDGAVFPGVQPTGAYTAECVFPL